MKVAILHTPLGLGDYPSLPDDAYIAQDDTDVIEPIAQACRGLGHEPTVVPIASDPAVTLAALNGTDVVFNMVEAIHGDSRFTAAATWLLEWARIPFTGATPEALTLGLMKPHVKAVLRAHGLRVPSGCVLAAGDDPIEDVEWPAIVKPAHEDSSSGIDARSVVHDDTAARARAREIIDIFRQPAMVETFIDGRELMVSVLGRDDDLTVLPIREALYGRFPEGFPHMLTFAAKWDPASDEAKMLDVGFAEDLSDEVTARVRETALKAFRAVGLRHYGRIDMRLGADDVPYVIEVNPNPDLVPTEGFPQSALAAGIAYDDLIGRLIDLALTDPRW